MSNPRIITFYLPQYHQIPENDKWWGKGFTDWINVTKARPRFKGHYQPHLPAELGFYDLRNEETRIAQAELADKYGLSGFCYYHYWFNGKMLLERPFNEVLSSGEPDFPFCLCWANENWTRSWDGMDKEILMEQNYNEYNPEEHMLWLEKAFSDKRYIRINGKPIFLVYNTNNIPDLKNIINKWRRVVKEKGYPGIFLCSVKSIHNKLGASESISLGFDALVDFFPSNKDNLRLKLWSIPKNYMNRIINKLLVKLSLDKKIPKLQVTYIVSYESFVKKKINEQINEYKTFPCVIPSWDNSARKNYSLVMQNDNSEIYAMWLENAFEKVKHYSPNEQIVFINAWNEWAEGCHLEPDLRCSNKFLKATLQVVSKWRSNAKS